VSNAHKVLFMEEGVTAKAIGTTAKDALLVEAWNNQVVEVSRYMGCPPFMLGATTQLPYNSRESAMREWADIEVRPRARLIEGAIKSDLIVEDDVVCAHDLSELKRGDALAQQQADCGYVLGGIKTPEEVRQDLGMSVEPVVGELRRAANIGTDPGGDNRPVPRPGDPMNPPPPGQPGQPPGRPSQPPKKKSLFERQLGAAWEIFPEHVRAALESIEPSLQIPVEPPPDADAQILSLATSHAELLLHRETERIRQKAVKLANDPPTFSSWLADFYLDHGQRMAWALRVGKERVGAYTRRHREEVERDGIGVCERWESGEAVKEMVEMVTKQETLLNG